MQVLIDGPEQTEWGIWIAYELKHWERCQQLGVCSLFKTVLKYQQHKSISYLRCNLLIPQMFPVPSSNQASVH